MNNSPTTQTLRVDRQNAMIRGVSVISLGEAKGHGLVVDETTLKQVEREGIRLGKCPVKINHKSGVEAVCGHLVNFRSKGDKVLADWKLLKSHPQFAQIMETAEEQPETVGLSASFTSPESAKFGANGSAAARVDELLSVDYVIQPAANPDGLFTAQFNGRVIHFSRKLNFGNGAGTLAALLIAKRAKDAAQRAIRSPLMKAAGYGAAGAVGAGAARLLLPKQKRDEDEKRAESFNKKFSAESRIHGSSPAPNVAIYSFGGGAQCRAQHKTSLHLEAITETITELTRVPGPVRRPERARPNNSSAGGQSRNGQGQFQPGPVSTPETMREAYVTKRPKDRASLSTRLRALRMERRRQLQNSNL